MLVKLGMLFLQKTKIVVAVSMLFCIVTLESKQFNAPYTALGKAYTFSKQLPIKCMRYLVILNFLLHLFRPNKTTVERKLKTYNQIKTKRFEYCKTFQVLMKFAIALFN